jgi:hypothetical protein
LRAAKREKIDFLRVFLYTTDTMFLLKNNLALR